MSTLIEILESQLNVDVDTMDPNASRGLPFTPHDMTSNQFVVNAQMQVPENREMFLSAVREYGDQGWEAVLDRISALLCAANIDNLQGRVLLQISTVHAYDTQKVVDHARNYVAELEKVGIPKDRICIKIPSTGPALNAGPILLKDGIRILGTCLFSVAQAIAASQAGCLSISPYFNEVRAHSDPSLQCKSEDPAIEHPMSPRMMQMLETYKRMYKETGKEQPMIKAASFISVEEIMACGEMEMHHATIFAPLLAVLCKMPALLSPSARIPGVPKVDMSKPYADARPTPARLVAVSKTDPLIPGWDGTLPSININYLANNGEELTRAIEADPVTKQRLFDALEAFKMIELSSKAIIETAIADLKA